MHTQAVLYDLFYRSMKDYCAEAGQIADLVRRARPHCRTLLDVGCGTGEHARVLGEVHGFEVDGIDIDPEMIATARARWPRGRFEVADLTDFHLGRRYDAVLCMFGATGHALTVQRLRDALVCMRDHLAPGGVAIVQPHLMPDELRTGTGEYSVESGDVQVKRARRSERDGQRQQLHFDFAVEDPDGTQELEELEELDEADDLALSTVDETLAAFSAVGLAADYDPGSPVQQGGRGFYLASARA